MKTVLITGGTGLVGSRLTEMLLNRGYAVTHLSRTANTKVEVKTYAWDIPNGKIDETCLREADYMVHLAGAGIADHRWTAERKKEILNSRTDSILLIAKALKTTSHHIQALVSASGISYYGTDTGDVRLTEQSPAGTDFLADVSVRWEAAADAVAALAIRTVKLRTGIVLSDKGGALPKLVAPIRWGAGAALGSGKQYQSWIHLDDLCRMYIEALEQTTWNGAYNAVAPLPTTNAELTRLAAQQLHRPLYLPKVPAWTLQLAFGEMAQVVTGGNYIINQRIATETSFQYQFPDLRKALADLLH